MDIFSAGFEEEEARRERMLTQRLLEARLALNEALGGADMLAVERCKVAVTTIEMLIKDLNFRVDML